MKEIKFRGLSKNGWIYGMPTYDLKYIFNEDQVDSPDNYEVDPETVGQSTGIKDKNRKDIYDSDIVSMRTEFILNNDFTDEDTNHDKTYTGEVVTIASKGVCLKNPKYKCNITGYSGQDKWYKPITAARSKVIGNIHQNKDILK